MSDFNNKNIEKKFQMLDIDHNKAEQILKSFQIPIKPQILADLHLEDAKPEPSPIAFSHVISRDIGLSSKVLKAVNSPVFGLKRTVVDIKQSVVLLGCKNIINLVSFFQLQKSFNKPSAISNDDFWDNAVEMADMMTLVIEHLSLKSECPIEEAYAFGLFRDSGIIIMAQKYADYRSVLAEANQTFDRTFTEVEDKYYPVNHATLGYYVSSSWNLPKPLCELILRHHDIGYLEDSDVQHLQKVLYATSKIATNVLSQYKEQRDDSEWELLKKGVLEYLFLSEIDYEELEEDLKETFKSQ